jgi:hypothetical protein
MGFLRSGMSYNELAHDCIYIHFFKVCSVYLQHFLYDEYFNEIQRKVILAHTAICIVINFETVYL